MAKEYLSWNSQPNPTGEKEIRIIVRGWVSKDWTGTSRFLHEYAAFIAQNLRTETDSYAMNLQRLHLNAKPSCSKSWSVRWDGALNATSTHDVWELTLVSLLLQSAANTGSTVRHSREMILVIRGGGGGGPQLSHHCRSAHLCWQDGIAWNSPVFPHYTQYRTTHFHHYTPGDILQLAQTVVGSLWWVPSGSRCNYWRIILKTGDHSPNFEFWYLVIIGELVILLLIHSENPTSVCTLRQ